MQPSGGGKGFAGAAWALAGLLMLLASTGTTASPRIEVVASGLDNPRGLAFGPDGFLYVAEAGRGGPGPCARDENFDLLCFGLTGSVTRIRGGKLERVVTSLNSVAHADDGFAFGPHDVSFRGRDAYVVVGGCFVGLHDGLLSKGLTMPTAVVVGPDRAIYISNCGTCAGAGQVIRFVP